MPAVTLSMEFLNWFKIFSISSGAAFFGQLAYFLGYYHGKSPPHLAGPGRFNGGVQSQELGLVGHILEIIRQKLNFPCRGPKKFRVT
jgi:hypothetical protein